MSALWENYKQLGFPNAEAHTFPGIVNLEVYRGDCPCNCGHCPVGRTERSQRRVKFGNASMDLGLYKKIVDEVALHPHATVRLHSVGEPLLWEGLGEIPGVHPRSVRAWIFTSAVTTDKRLLELLCESIRIIEVSVNSTDPLDYRATKGVNAFDLVSDNIRFMHEFIQKRGLPTRLIVSRVQSRDPVTDEAFVSFWKSTGWVQDAFVRSYHTYNGLLDEQTQAVQQPRHQACLVHWNRFNISVEGCAVVCFNELFKDGFDPALVYGDVKRQTIAEIWHGELVGSVRRAELSQDYTQIPMKDRLPCPTCTTCQPLFGNCQTSEHQVELLKADHG